ncbi:MAG: ATP-binding protein [Xenococcaceae cyanobacterium MO_188.B32]|nr:ATP-binding protein [Xenococcaceae cyanobacterium MO_188.B32]
MEPLTVPGTLDSLGAIAKYVMAAASEASLDKKTSYKLRLAVDEIATNIIVYAYQQANYEGSVNLRAKIDEQSLTIYVEDTGVAFNPVEKIPLEKENLHKPLEERPIGGLGLYLAVDGVDKFFYERVGDRNRNIFVVNRTKS